MSGIGSLAIDKLKQFSRDSCASLTVESVLWLPIYLLFFGLVVDVSLMFHAKAKATRVVYDGNRQASLGILETEADVEAAVISRVAGFSPEATADTVFGPNSVTTTLTMPSSDLTVVGVFSSFLNLDVVVASIHLRDI